jgi:peroxiredoxin
VLAVGDPIPDVRVWMGPQEQVSLRELAAEKPLLLVFYLFDWAKSQ